MRLASGTITFSATLFLSAIVLCASLPQSSAHASPGGMNDNGSEVTEQTPPDQQRTQRPVKNPSDVSSQTSHNQKNDSKSKGADSSLSKSDKKSKKDELPKSGTLSVSGTTGYRSLSIPPTWGVKDDSEGSTAPISGSVARLSPKEFEMRLFNNTPDSYSVTLKVVQTSSKGSELRSDHFSYSLRPNAKETRKISAHASASGSALVLESWKKTSKSADDKKEDGSDKKPGDAAAADAKINSKK